MTISISISAVSHFAVTIAFLSLSACGGGEVDSQNPMFAPAEKSATATVNTSASAPFATTSRGYARAGDNINEAAPNVFFMGQTFTSNGSTGFGGKRLSDTEVEVFFGGNYYILSKDPDKSYYTNEFVVDEMRDSTGNLIQRTRRKLTLNFNLTGDYVSKGTLSVFGQIDMYHGSGNGLFNTRPESIPSAGSNGFWNNPNASLSTQYVAFFGYATDPAQLTGTVSYTGEADVTVFRNLSSPFGIGQSDSAQGAVAFTADFGAGTLNGQIDVNDPTGDVARGSFDLEALPISIDNGQITGNQFRADLTSATFPVLNGALFGAFFGPNGEEASAKGTMSAGGTSNAPQYTAQISLHAHQD